ncbi:hypothetical protein [Puerhibacterium puerhi]|uniref:hypothetical protein n=1 Tax=Puerhibacterium puerhi TaxID=2692623 RepID=UPI0013574EA1|nr:hypothetical protein [Puerhibacterium puerhi]
MFADLAVWLIIWLTVVGPVLWILGLVASPPTAGMAASIALGAAVVALVATTLLLHGPQAATGMLHVIAEIIEALPGVPSHTGRE